jgi:hypothetical protein
MLLDPTRAQVIGRLMIGAAAIAVRMWLDELVPRGRVARRARAKRSVTRLER